MTRRAVPRTRAVKRTICPACHRKAKMLWDVIVREPRPHRVKMCDECATARLERLPDGTYLDHNFGAQPRLPLE